MPPHHSVKIAAWVSLPGAYTLATISLHVFGALKHPESIKTAALWPYQEAIDPVA
jgi:hypothetical protein